MSTLWLLLVPICAGAYTLLMPLAPNDLWYNARAGAYICQNGQIPTTALFTSSVPPDTPYLYQSWIAQILLFQGLEQFGLSGLVIGRSILIVLCFAVIQWAAWRRVKRIAPLLPETTRARLVAGSTLVAFGLAASNMEVRPQLFSFPLFCVFVWMLWEWPFLHPRQRSIATGLLTLLMLLWVNTHGAFFTGLVLISAFVFGQLLDKNAAKKPALVLATLCFAATLFNPRGAGIYGYIWQFTQLKASRYIQEWQAPRITDWYGALLFLTLFAVAVMGGVLALRRRQPETEKFNEKANISSASLSWGSALMVCAMAVMALRDVRSIIWFAYCVAPMLAALGALLLYNDSKAQQPEVVPRAAQFINGFIALLLILGLIPLLPKFKAGLPMPPEYSDHFAPTPRGAFPAGFDGEPQWLLENDTPVRAVEWLSENPPRGKLWNEFVYGSYLAWATLYQPRLAPYADPRVEMRSLEFWEEYGRIIDGAPDASSTLRAQGFSDVLLNLKEQKKLIGVLKTGGWREQMRSGDTIVLRVGN